jgi:hypothetical protein
MVAMKSEAVFVIQLFLNTSGGRIFDFITALVAFLLALKTLYDAYMGRWYPGRRGSNRPPIKAEWYHRLFMVTLALFVLYGACILFLRLLTPSWAIGR